MRSNASVLRRLALGAAVVLRQGSPLSVAGCRLGSVVLVATLLVPTAEATHQMDHRYLVLGYIHDGAGRPLPGIEVRGVRRKTGLAYQAETDAGGFYLLVFHLHDEDESDSLEITAGPAAIRIRARFDPRDRKSHRGTRVDFRGGRAQERPESFVETVREYLKQ